MTSTGQAVRSGPTNMNLPTSPRSTLPGYIRRSSTAISTNQNASSSSSAASLRNSTIPTTPSTASTIGSQYFSNVVVSAAAVPDTLERPRDRSRNNEVSSSALAFLFAEMVSYTQNRVSGISDLEKKLSLLGYRVGQRVLPLLSHRIEFPVAPSQSTSLSVYNRIPKREVRLLAVLLWLHTQLWKALFGRAADNLERSTEKSDECAFAKAVYAQSQELKSLRVTITDMISTNTPLFAKSMSVPKEMNQLSVEAFTAGIVEAALDGLGFVSEVEVRLRRTRESHPMSFCRSKPARVTAHSVPSLEFPQRTTILVKLNKEVMDREEALGPA